MKSNPRGRSSAQVILWVISLLVVISMLCALVGSLFYASQDQTSLLPLMQLAVLAA
jgi:hypothetical protein